MTSVYYAVWFYGKTFTAQSKTKVTEKVIDFVGYLPYCFEILKYQNGKVVATYKTGC